MDSYEESDSVFFCHNALKNISKTKSKVVVYIELNPYVEVNNNFTLAQCNVFFRHANGRYIPKVGKL